MKHFRTDGIIIKRRNFGEADRILTVMTREYGKISIKATGVRKITSRRSAHIELLNHTTLHLYKGHTFSVLTEARMMDDFSLIKCDFTKVGLAYHLCELVDGLCPENQENVAVFFLLKNTLERLCHTEASYAPLRQAHYAVDDYTLGTYGIDLNDAPRQVVPQRSSTTLEQFEMNLLSELGYWNNNESLAKSFDTHAMIESIMERKLKAHSIFAKLQ